MGIARIKRNLDVDTQDVGVRCNLNGAIGLSFASIYCRRQRKGGKDAVDFCLHYFYSCKKKAAQKYSVHFLERFSFLHYCQFR